MKKALFFLKIKIFVSILGVLFTLQGCEKSEVAELEDAKPAELFQVNEFNTDMKNFTLAVRNALRSNAGFREFIRDEAMRKIDGDYNVILKKVVDKEISSTDGLKSAAAGFTVKDLLEGYHPYARTYRLKSGTSIIDELMAKYPYLQISVPVHAESWDPANYTPVVTFLPLEYSDATTKTLTGYNPEGGIVHLCVINVPTSPVIVVSQNERLPSGIEYAIIDNPTPVAPGTPTNLRGFQTGSGIKLVWDMPAGTGPSNTNGYFVYRKDEGAQTFSRIHTVSEALNTAFNDNNVLAEHTYSYFVVAHFQGVESGRSNIVTLNSPNFPNPVMSFDALLTSRNSILLRWRNAPNILETRLYKYTLGVSNGFQLLRSFTANEMLYYDRNVLSGDRSLYKIKHTTPLGLSSPTFDFVKAPFRNFPEKSPVYIKQIRFADWSLERWPAGKPEFSITLSNFDRKSRQTRILVNRRNFYFSSRSNESQRFFGKWMHDWEPVDWQNFQVNWYDVLTFTAMEFDRSIFNQEMKVGAGFNVKVTDRTSLSFQIANLLTKIFQDKGEMVGNAFLSYYERPEQWLRFQKYGVEILVSDKDE